MADELEPTVVKRRPGRPTKAQVEAELAGISSLPDGPEDSWGLTPRQRRVLHVIKEAVETIGYPPSIRELAQQAGLSVMAVAALQHVSGSCLSLFSPVRMTMAAGMAQGQGQERRVYAGLLPYALAAVLLLTLAAVALVWLR